MVQGGFGFEPDPDTAEKGITATGLFRLSQIPDGSFPDTEMGS
jgi:hypothetical protein